MKRLVGILTIWWVLGANGRAVAEPTYCKDIAPILWKNCAGCHRPGEVGPFPLLTYKDAARRASFLTDVIHSGKMPPWKPEPGFGSFHDERRLTDAEIDEFPSGHRRGRPRGTPRTYRHSPGSPRVGSSARRTWCSRSPRHSVCRPAAVTSTAAS